MYFSVKFDEATFIDNYDFTRFRRGLGVGRSFNHELDEEPRKIDPRIPFIQEEIGNHTEKSRSLS